MNTNKLKTFAQDARNILLPNVTQRLRYWGFDDKGNFENELITVQGGYLFRGKPYADTTVPLKLERLAEKINSAQTFKDVREEAAYTWFNRLMAIKILEANGYDAPVLAYSQDGRTPMLLQNAKRGSFAFVPESSQALLRTYLTNSQDEEAFALLLTHYCNQHDMLRTVFGKINDYTEILTPMNLLSANGLVQLINANDAITADDYKEVELIGWLYQFYISDRKDEVFANFKKRKKARAEDIPAATQIFTPKWIVQYMVENTLGKLYLDYEPDADDLKDSLKYLVESTGESTDNSSETLIQDIEDLRILDPACGSGHILVVAFDLLMKAYDEEGYDKRQAAKAILTKHLYGLDIDDRAAQLANFAVRLKAAQYDKNLLTTTAHIPIVAFPEAMTVEAEDVAFCVGETAKHLTIKVENALELLQQGKNLGAVIQLDFTETDRQQLYAQWQAQQTAYDKQQLSFSDGQRFERLQPFINIMLILTDRFPAVVANPPYMGSKSMNAELRSYLDKNYTISKSDLMTVFGEVLQNMTQDKGGFAFIVPPSWMFLSSFEKFRNLLLKNNTIDSLLHLSRGVFGADFGSSCAVFKKEIHNDSKGNYFRLVERTFQEFDQRHLEELFLKTKSNPYFKYDFSTYSKQNDSLEHSDDGKQIFYPQIPQINFAKIPGSPIAYWVSERVVEIFEEADLLGKKTTTKVGLDTGNNTQFLRLWHEVEQKLVGYNFLSKEHLWEEKKKWVPHTKGGAFRKWYGNLEFLIAFDSINYEILKVSGNKLPSENLYFLEGVNWSRVGAKDISLRLSPVGTIFNSGCPTVFDNRTNLYFLMGYLNSVVVKSLIPLINPTINFQSGTINKLPLIIKNQTLINKFVQTNIQISKTDWDSRETSWDFKQSPLIAAQGEDLAAAYEKWVGQVTADFYQLHANEEELNRIFIDIYGLQDELTPDIPLKDITILQEELDRKALDKLSVGAALPIDRGEVVRQLLSYCIGCAMGRYHLGKTALHIAHPQATTEETAAYTFVNIAGENQTFQMDEDGILPLIGSDSPFPDDMVKFVTRIIEQIWGKDVLVQNLNFINEALGTTLENYLNHPTKGFWKHHTRQYKKRPIYWLFSSGQKGQSAFQVIAYLHRMDKYTIQKIRTRYLHPYQAYLNEQIEKAKADLSFSPKDLDKLEQAAIECRSYDETLKGLESQQIDLDLDHGVLENYGLFGKAVRKV